MPPAAAPTIGIVFPPDLPPEDLRAVALAADEPANPITPQLWLWEDCFKESGIATAAAVLAWTERVEVGIGLLPVPLRNVALTAMELATISRLFPGRLVPGVGHGVLDWMGQVGARADSPMTLLREYTGALRELLRGGTVDVAGRYVTLHDVTLDWPPVVVPPLLIGAVGPKTVALAGESGDGVILTGETSPSQVAAARQVAIDARSAAGRGGEPQVVVFATIDGNPSARDAADRIRDYTDAGATTVAVHSVGDARPPLPEFVAFLARDVAPLITG